MNHRWSELLASETITAAATRQPIDIKALDPITRLTIMIKLTNNGSTPTDHPAKALVNVKITDGSDVLMSLNGMEAQALSFYNAKVQPFADLIYLNNVMALIAFDIYFGRWLHDPLLAFDPKKFKNPQLTIQHNLAAGGSAPDSMDLRIRAELFDAKEVSPVGYLMSKEHYSYSLASSGNEVIELPLDHPIRMLMIMSRAADKAPHEQYNLIKLSEEEDKKVLIEAYTSDLQKIMASLYPEWVDKIFGATDSSGVDHFITPTFSPYPSVISEGGQQTAYFEAFHNGGTQKVYKETGANFIGIVTGRCPHGAIPIHMGDQDDPDDWWNVPALEKAKLKITAGSSVESSSTCQVVTQQFRKY